MFKLEIPVNVCSGIMAEEKRWREGDLDSAFRVCQLKEFNDYRDALAEQLVRAYGPYAKAFAAVSAEQFDALTTGRDITVGFYRTVEEAKVHRLKGGLILSAHIRPFMAFMLGNPGEIVCRTDFLSFKTMAVVDGRTIGDSSRLLV